MCDRGERVDSDETGVPRGEFRRSNAAEGQYWGTETPITPGFANKYGAATLGVGAPDFKLAGTVRAVRRFITRTAPRVGTNSGGALEAVIRARGITLDYFHMP